VKGRLADVEPDALAVFHPKYKMHMGMRFIGMKRQCVPMFKAKRLARKASNGGQELVRKCPRRHAKEKLMYELPRLMARREVDPPSEFVQIKVPVLYKATGRRFVGDLLAVIGLEHPVFTVRNVPQVPPYRRQVIAARTDDSDHYFRGSIAETRGTHPGINNYPQELSTAVRPVARS
jgi:hypothetical protein